MARPVNADSAATRRRILECATVLFAEQGQAKSSIREIAKLAGVSLGMVHHYYGSKDQLFAACIDTMYAELAELRAHLADSVLGGQPVERLADDAIRATFRFTREHQTAMRLMMRQVVASGELDQKRRDDFLLPFLDQASALVGAAVGRPPAELRLPLQSIVFLTGRFAIASDRELMLVCGARNIGAAVASVEDHLVTVAKALLGLP